MWNNDKVFSTAVLSRFGFSPAARCWWDLCRCCCRFVRQQGQGRRTLLWLLSCMRWVGLRSSRCACCMVMIGLGAVHWKLNSFSGRVPFLHALRAMWCDEIRLVRALTSCRCFLEQIGQHLKYGVLQKNEFKIVYVAPMKVDTKPLITFSFFFGSWARGVKVCEFGHDPSILQLVFEWM